jgi:arylsulfatase A-like enzyme
LRNARQIDQLLVEQFREWLDEHADERMFVWIHLLTPHYPYIPPPWTKRRVASSLERFAVPGQTDQYDGEVIAADELVGRVLDAIDGRIGEDRSVVVFTSDHGEAFGEHGMYEHGHTLHAEVVRVPLVVRAPSAPAGRRVQAAVRTIDVLPTILELVGADNQLPEDARGQSLVPLLAADGENREVYSEGMLYGPTERALLVGGDKVVYNEQSETSQLFDWLLDPEETVNLKMSRPELADSLMARLEATHEELFRDFERRAGSGVSDENAEQFRKALESLGYIDGHVDSVRRSPNRETQGRISTGTSMVSPRYRQICSELTNAYPISTNESLTLRAGSSSLLYVHGRKYNLRPPTKGGAPWEEC